MYRLQPASAGGFDMAERVVEKQNALGRYADLLHDVRERRRFWLA